MTKKEFLALFEDIVEADPGTLTGRESLRQDIAGWNSLAAVSFIAMVDEHFGVTLAPSRIAASQTLDDLIGLLDGRVNG